MRARSSSPTSIPAGSEAAPTLPRTWRPRGPRVAAVVFGAVLVGAFAYLWLSFDDATRASVSWLQRFTVSAIVGAALAGMFALARSRVEATADGLVVVNGYRRHEYDWAEVVAVRMPQGAPWPTLDLADGSTASVMGIHASDGTRAREAVTELKRIVARH